MTNEFVKAAIKSFNNGNKWCGDYEITRRKEFDMLCSLRFKGELDWVDMNDGDERNHWFLLIAGEYFND